MEDAGTLSDVEARIDLVDGAFWGRDPHEELAWLRAYCPVGSIGGGSVLVYRFDRPPGPAPGPDRPAAPCFGDRWSTRG